MTELTKWRVNNHLYAKLCAAQWRRLVSKLHSQLKVMVHLSIENSVFDARQCPPWETPISVSFFCETQGTKRHQKGLFPDFQLRVHMHCPGQVSIQREMKRKKINSFYMNAQQAVLVCVYAWRRRAKRVKCTTANSHKLPNTHCGCAAYMHILTWPTWTHTYECPDPIRRQRENNYKCEC